ncbi:hypothetical protein GUITHDRAFT_138396 [Guillardia theta CCMP2712]|uniref:Uncharacterized protein n=1 Tax=Guillardia theta (strain CCMP2712) TaxID=905079 RepID=L1JCQ3_GUITC|nr:hypothetical protein GUITHDRAFT_138396 [Guillardia theta CCMP2712]EKX46303.1 hypothetical protein GUITHDRAFT_138396 [Guillardia theta CCMP2712]|eukprot:XP_005833283.1 hypothetical protein GUITHDRAFT_138396 [Guillardia theta CCMP2712]
MLTMIYARALGETEYQRNEIARLAQVKEIISELKGNEHARLIEEIEAIREEKNNQIVRLTNMYRRREISREDLYSTRMARLSERLACLEAERVATLNNRDLIEIGMLRIHRNISIRKGIRKTVRNHLLMGKDSLSLSNHSKQVCQDLAQYDFGLDERSVAEALTNLMLEISTSLHGQVFLLNEPPGCYVGGSPPFANDPMVYLVDGSKKQRCTLHQGKVLPLVAPTWAFEASKPEE